MHRTGPGDGDIPFCMTWSTPDLVAHQWLAPNLQTKNPWAISLAIPNVTLLGDGDRSTLTGGTSVMVLR